MNVIMYSIYSYYILIVLLLYAFIIMYIQSFDKLFMHLHMGYHGVLWG